MIVYGYALDRYYDTDGTLLIQVRIPQIHGPYMEGHYNGRAVKNYVRDENIPYYHSLVLPRLPNAGDVVAMTSINEKEMDFLIIGLTGGSYQSGYTINY